MLNKWQDWYMGLDTPQAYGDTVTYGVGERYLSGLDVEDWGCGKGFFKTIHTGGYVGVDGTPTPYTDVVADLREYTSSTQGLFMRHVLEHNLEWEMVLNNALQSFTTTMVLVLFTPLSSTTHQIAWNDEVEVPDMSFAHSDMIDAFSDTVGVKKWVHHDFQTNTQYGTERVYVVHK